MIQPMPGKILVELFSLQNPYIHLPDTIRLSTKLSVAEVVLGGSFEKGQKVLVPSKAGLDIKENGTRYRLINESDIVAEVRNGGTELARDTQ